MFTVIDYGVGNLGSISNMLNYLGVPHRVSALPADILSAERLLLPGVGAFDYAASKLKESGLIEALNQRVLLDRVPVLGICVGMQIMCRGSEEGVLPGLAWFEADVRRFDPARMDTPHPVPHMGWNDISVQSAHPVLEGLAQPARFYFVHSYHVVCDRADDVSLRARYGYAFDAGIARDNLIAVQFHPEKSHKFGLSLLANFARWNHVPA